MIATDDMGEHVRAVFVDIAGVQNPIAFPTDGAVVNDGISEWANIIDDITLLLVI